MCVFVSGLCVCVFLFGREVVQMGHPKDIFTFLLAYFSILTHSPNPVVVDFLLPEPGMLTGRVPEEPKGGVLTRATGSVFQAIHFVSPEEPTPLLGLFIFLLRDT